MTIAQATSQKDWDGFLQRQQFRPFLQSWTMGEVYRRIGQEPVRLMIKDGEHIRGICFAHIVPARRGRHLSIPYGPIMENGKWKMENTGILVDELKKIAREHRCSFIRMSPFWIKSDESSQIMKIIAAKRSPLHLLAEHLWYLPLGDPDPWSSFTIFHFPFSIAARSEENLFKRMRSTTRNLIRRAEKEGVIVTCSDDPVRDLPLFLQLHEETRKRHHFTPYTHAFFRAQVEEFAMNGLPTEAPAGAKAGNVLLYLAHHQGQLLAASIHMHFGGETSYHHGASAQSKIPASYLLQWAAIKDALKRGDHVYNFWGIAPAEEKKHPFAGVTLFKTGFGGNLLELTHCVDIPLSPAYRMTRLFETLRKWKRGF